MKHDRVLKYAGAVFGWVWSKRFQDWSWTLLYWPVDWFEKIVSQIFDRRPLIILAGFMSQGRGRYWDRRSRRGLK